MKPWEETWVCAGVVIDGHTFGPWRVFSKTPGHLVCTVGDGCSNPDAANMVAAAPELVRVLLAIEAKAISDVSECGACGQPVTYWIADSGRDYHDPYLGHEVDCALDAALAKAGVR